MPLGNLTSQFFANVYLHKLDHFIKHTLKARFYIRYVDDFVILHNSKGQLEIWRSQIDKFLKEKLKLELHKDKSKVIPLSKGIDFVGFRNFSHYKLLRKRNIRKMKQRIENYKNGKATFSQLFDSYKGWQAYIRWGNSHKAKENIKQIIISALLEKL